MSLSTFSGLFIAKRGVQSARVRLQITGQNMTNVNTEGYTKQSVDTYSISPSQGNMRLAGPSLQVGEGVSSDRTSQSRDPYLDILYRGKSSEYYQANTTYDTLTSLGKIIDETINDGICSRLSDLEAQIQTYAKTPSDTNLESTVKNSAKLLAQQFNTSAKKLTELRSNTEGSIENAVKTVNGLLDSIASYNKQIKSAELSGSSALEVKDKLNSAIDELSKYGKIKVEYGTESAGVTTVTKLKISLENDDGSTKTLVDGGDYNTLSASKNASTGDYTINWKETSSGTVSATDFSSGTIGAYRTMLNDDGEFDNMTGTGTTTTRGIGYYQKILDKMANQFAKVMNSQNSTDSAGTNKPLFESSDSSNSTVTASNIAITKKWETASVYLTTTKKAPTTGSSGTTSDASNLLSMIDALAQKTSFTTDANNSPSSSTALFESSIDTYMSQVTNTVFALQAGDVKRNRETADSELSDTQQSRDSVSGVDINEEGINMIQYNQAFSASSRFMTTINEMLDTLINQMGVI
jgi:flagellar hook-associated protein FlgK